jgi:hypothetical protein
MAHRRDADGHRRAAYQYLPRFYRLAGVRRLELHYASITLVYFRR